MRTRRVGLLIILIVMPLCSFHMGEEAPWWRLDVVLSVQGEYRLNARAARWTATYECELNGCAVLEGDNDDFLLYQVETEYSQAKVPRWVEIMDAGMNHRVVHYENQALPELDLSYALRQAGQVRVGLMTRTKLVPFHSSGRKLSLIFPQTFTGINDARENAYSRGIISGSNILEIDPQWLEAKGKNTGSLQWEWRDETGSWSHRHSVRVTFELIRGERDSN